jgi:predicted lipid-binding transport protein (Tim44 family)
MSSTIEELAHRVVPGARIGDRAAADRTLRRYNVIGVFRDVTDARSAIARVEDVAGDGMHVQYVGFETSTREDTQRGAVDPEGVTGQAARGIAVGHVIGGAVGVLVIGGLVLLLTGDAGITLAAALGAALIIGVIGALVVNFSKFGASDAWRQTFQPDDPPVSLVAVLTDDRDAVGAAADVLRSHGAAPVELRDDHGETVT